MENNFKGKRVLITGASKGLGKAAAMAFEKEGAKLALVARSDEKLKVLNKSFEKSENHQIFNMDLLESKNIETISSSIKQKWGGLDIILHCVGGSLGVNDTLVSWEDLSRCLNGNIGIAAEINCHFVPLMKEQGFGILATSSWAPSLDETASLGRM